MEFTEVEELNILTSHGRGYPNGKANSNLAISTSSQEGPILKGSIASNPLFDYEKALDDTPPNSPQKLFNLQPIQTSKVLDGEEEETIEDIFEVIQSTLTQQNVLQISANGPEEKIEIKEKVEKIDEEKAEVKDKKEDDSPSNDKNEQASTYFEKMREDDVSKTYKETKNIKSFLSSNIKAFPV